jgi:hypothetical protein
MVQERGIYTSKERRRDEWTDGVHVSIYEWTCKEEA